MSRLITCRRCVTNVPPTLLASTASSVSAPLIGEHTPPTEATPTTSSVPISSTSLMSVQPLSAQQPHRRRREPEPFDQTSSSSRVEGEASQPEHGAFSGTLIFKDLIAQSSDLIEPSRVQCRWKGSITRDVARSSARVHVSSCIDLVGEMAAKGCTVTASLKSRSN